MLTPDDLAYFDFRLITLFSYVTCHDADFITADTAT